MNQTGTRSLRGHARRGGLALAIAMLGLGAFPAEAQTDAPATPSVRPARQEVGPHTRGILEIQRSGAQAGELQVLHGEQAALSYQRYMATFTYPIPEFYTGQAGSKNGSGGGASQGVAGR
ncbi:DUF3613 domain-containing protein [Cupriavidus basilensis]|uniref:DUF3613 domain-containing protein n=1 Tax=Cupriavidus basilensis TaxID=68895 RepID=A0A643FMB1_9BURK|nr:DUF3613 domain-containing protein [Cupriavidus basilensis]QOT79748.1 DUF3613 domain-containing protein [Cupriavidus basilensis]